MTVLDLDRSWLFITIAMNTLKVTNYAISWKSCFHVNNTKSSFERVLSSQKLAPKSVEYHSNFAVIRYFNIKFVYIIFYSGHVNCTGISNLKSIPLAVNLFKETYSIPISSFKVKAIAATSELESLISHRHIYSLLQKSTSDIRISIVSNKFVGLMFRFKIGGSVQIFYSGKVNFLGARDLHHLKFMSDVVSTLIKL